MITLETVLKATKGTTQLQGGIEFTGITTDSRSIKPGELFVALKGEKFDGHTYCKKALQDGARAVLVENLNEIEEDKAIVVKDTLRAYQEIAHAYRMSNKKLKVVAITGSNGKTSTKDLIAACLASKYNVTKTQANFNNEIGLPKTLLSVTEKTDIAVVEMGMRGLGQIRALKALAKPDVVVITNVGETHMELLGSMDNIAKAKSEILEDLTAENTAVLNGDDPYVSKMKTNAKTVTYGIIKGNILQGMNLEISGNGTTFSYQSGITKATKNVAMPLIGKHNVMNALAAIAVAEVFNVSDEDIVGALNGALLTEKRQEVLHFGKVTAINDAYNASPASMETGLETLKKVVEAQKKGRAVAVLADMLELGASSLNAHKKVGEWAAKNGVKLLITYGTESKATYEAAKNKGVASFYCKNKEEAATILKDNLQDNDVILFKGSHSMEVDKVIDLALKDK